MYTKPAKEADCPITANLAVQLAQLFSISFDASASLDFPLMLLTITGRTSTGDGNSPSTEAIEMKSFVRLSIIQPHLS